MEFASELRTFDVTKETNEIKQLVSIELTIRLPLHGAGVEAGGGSQGQEQLTIIEP